MRVKRSLKKKSFENSPGMMRILLMFWIPGVGLFLIQEF